MHEQPLDVENWKYEAEAVIQDVKEHVKQLIVSEKISSDDKSVYLNLTTNEDNKYCVQLSGQGFRVIGKNFDENNVNSEKYFETPYSLLSYLSPSFEESFANALIGKLENISSRQ